jgi:hypothetical protein
MARRMVLTKDDLAFRPLGRQPASQPACDAALQGSQMPFIQSAGIIAVDLLHSSYWMNGDDGLTGSTFGGQAGKVPYPNMLGLLGLAWTGEVRSFGSEMEAKNDHV